MPRKANDKKAGRAIAAMVTALQSKENQQKTIDDQVARAARQKALGKDNSSAKGLALDIINQQLRESERKKERLKAVANRRKALGLD